MYVRTNVLLAECLPNPGWHSDGYVSTTVVKLKVVPSRRGTTKRDESGNKLLHAQESPFPGTKTQSFVCVFWETKNWT